MLLSWHVYLQSGQTGWRRNCGIVHHSHCWTLNRTRMPSFRRGIIVTRSSLNGVLGILICYALCVLWLGRILSARFLDKSVAFSLYRCPNTRASRAGTTGGTRSASRLDMGNRVCSLNRGHSSVGTGANSAQATNSVWYGDVLRGLAGPTLMKMTTINNDNSDED